MEHVLKCAFYILQVIFLVKSAAILVEPETKLILVSVIFRHGARTTYSFYPNDPNKNETFYPIGYGGLTNEGKLGEYKLGHYLRDLYQEFLGEVYTEENVDVRSTDVTRTKMSAQLVLAGLFPPSKIQLWNENLMWQPIPVSYKIEAEEDLFHPRASCAYKSHTLAHLSELDDIQENYIKPYQETYSYIQNNSGKNMSNPEDMQDFYFILKTEGDMNLILPEWTKNIFPEPTHGIASQVYSYHNYSPRLKQINAGYMLKKILDDSKAKIDGTLNKKIFLYSGHETTLGYMLNALDVSKPHVPPYGSAISFEIHQGDDQYYVKLRYRNDTEATQPVDLHIPGCDTLCPFDKFIELNKDLIPTVSIQEACKMEEADIEKTGNYLK